MPQATRQGVIRVAVVEDDPKFFATLTQIIKGAGDMALVGSAMSVAAGMDMLEQGPADVLLVDLGLPDGSGIELIKAARDMWRRCDIMVSTVFGDEAHVIGAIEAGATGYLLKDTPPEQLVAEIHSLYAGGSPISPLIARKLLSRFNAPASAPQATPPPQAVLSVLSPREEEVLYLIIKGFSHHEIAGRLGVSPHTVTTFVRRIYIKFGVKSKTEAVYVAHQRGMAPS